MTYFADDTSIADSRPVELYTFTSQMQLTPIVARSTSFQRDVTFGGNAYTARPIRRSIAAIVNLKTNIPEMTVEVAATDPIAAFYFGQQVPPQNVKCTIVRMQLRSGAGENIFEGLISEARISGRTATFTIAQRTDDALKTRFPNSQISQKCQHVLFDSRCGITRISQQISTSIASLGDFRTITLASFAPFATSDGEFAEGELVHSLTGERRFILDSIVATKQLVLDVRLPSTVNVGEGVLAWRGCDREITTCQNRFNNVPNSSRTLLVQKGDVFNFTPPGMLLPWGK